MSATKRWKAVLAAVLVAAAARTEAAPAQEVETHRLTGDRVAVYNLAGSLEVVRGGGRDVVVRVSRGGADAARLRVEVGPVDGLVALRVLYPGDHVVYPATGLGSTTTVTVDDDGTFGRGGGDRVTVQGSGEGIEAWADLRVEVPPGRALEAFVAAGEATASGVEGDLSIDTGSGSVVASGIRGRLRVDTGSGSVTVSDVEGEAFVDTGSGSVRLDRVRGERILVDTGSGRVDGAALTAASVHVDTGSGAIAVREVDAPDVYLDTGSGSVEVDLMSDVERLEVDTGSGAVTVRLPEDLGASLALETGSGSIEVDLPVQLRTMRRDEVRGTVGDGGGTIRIDTGSGGIRLVRR